jgi:hypothetical protein
VSWLWWAPLLAAALHIVMNALLILLCLSVAQSGRTAQGVAAWLTLAALLFGNAVFHLVGTVRTRRYSPGLVTGLLLYVPMAIVGFGHFLRARKAAALVILLILGAGCGFRRSDEVAFEFPHNQIVVEASLEGDGPHACLLDTGTNPSAVDAKLAAQIGLALTGPGGKADGVGHEDVTVHPTTVEVAVGASKPVRIDALVIDLGPISKKIGRPIGCILGQSWLLSRVVQIDYPKRFLRFSQTALDHAGTCEEKPMRYWVPDDAMPLVEVEVLGVAYPVTLDTGSSQTLKLFSKSNPPAGFEVLPGESKVTGFRGEASVQPARVATLRFGPLSLEKVDITLADPNLEETPGARMGNLGNGVLQHVVLTLDYRERRLIVCTGGAS